MKQLIFQDKAPLALNYSLRTNQTYHLIQEFMQLYTPVAISKFINLNVFYPLPYQRLVWDYKKDDVSSIQKALDSINWEKLFCNKSISVQASIFNETILNMFNNLVVNKIITCNGKDPI